MNVLIIEFDNEQVAFATDVAEAAEFVSEAFKHMLVADPDKVVGRVSFFRADEGYSIETRSLTLFPTGPVEELYPLIKDEIRLEFIRARPDLLWLHAGAVSRHRQALLLSGPSGQGKSTLSVALSARGWQYLSDDVSPLRIEQRCVIPFPQSPSHRVHPGREVERNELEQLRRVTPSLRPEALARGDHQLGAVIFVEYDAAGELEMRRLDPGPGSFSLLRNLTNFFDHKEAAVRAAAALTLEVPTYSLKYSDARAAAECLDSLW